MSDIPNTEIGSKVFAYFHGSSKSYQGVITGVKIPERDNDPWRKPRYRPSIYTVLMTEGPDKGLTNDAFYDDLSPVKVCPHCGKDLPSDL